MRSVNRDKFAVTYQLLKNDTSSDEFGNVITYTYSAPKIGYFTMSAGSGDTKPAIFGKDITYDRELVSHVDYGIDEYTKLIIDGVEYRVVHVAKTKACYRYAVSRVGGL